MILPKKQLASIENALLENSESRPHAENSPSDTVQVENAIPGWVFALYQDAAPGSGAQGGVPPGDPRGWQSREGGEEGAEEGHPISGPARSGPASRCEGLQGVGAAALEGLPPYWAPTTPHSAAEGVGSLPLQLLALFRREQV